MAGHVERARAIVANIKSKDRVVPSTSFLRTIGAAFVYTRTPDWQVLLSTQTLVALDSFEVFMINPDNPADPLDVGVVNRTTGVFTGASQNTKDHLLAIFYIRMQREYNRLALQAYRLKTTQIDGSNTGETAEGFRAATMSAANSEAITELGDNNNDLDS